MKCFVFFVLCVISVKGRVHLSAKGLISNFISDVKPTTTEKITIQNQNENSNSNRSFVLQNITTVTEEHPNGFSAQVETVPPIVKKENQSLSINDNSSIENGSTDSNTTTIEENQPLNTAENTTSNHTILYQTYENNSTTDNLIEAKCTYYNTTANIKENLLVNNKNETLQITADDNLINANCDIVNATSLIEKKELTNNTDIMTDNIINDQHEESDNLNEINIVKNNTVNNQKKKILITNDNSTIENGSTDSNTTTIEENQPRNTTENTTSNHTILYYTNKNISTTDDLIEINILKNNTTEIKDSKIHSCITDKDIFLNLLNSDYNISYIVQNLCKTVPKNYSFQFDTGKALLLTEYVKSGRTKEARTLAKVDSSHFLGISSYSGYFTVDEKYNSNTFFWYFPVLKKDVSKSPWMVWLQGGPGSSSLIGLFNGIGPFTVVNNSLILNPHTWLQNHSLLFIDNPVGTGYSFTDYKEGFVTNMTGYSKHMYSAIDQFLKLFPELRSAPLYVAGESYGGKYVPALAMEIHKRNPPVFENNLMISGINLQGLIVGNGYIDPDMIDHIMWPFFYFGMIDKAQIEMIKPLANSFHEDFKANNSIQAKIKWNHLVTVLLFITHQRHVYNFLDDGDAMQADKYVDFLKSPKIKKALHVGEIKYGFVNYTVNTMLAPDFLSSSKPLFEELLEHYKVLVYCGQLDQALPCAFASDNYRTWKWNGSEAFNSARRLPFLYERKLAGYQKTGGRFTEAVVRGAGHMVPLNRPAVAQHLVTSFTHDQKLSTGISSLLEGSYISELVRNYSSFSTSNYNMNTIYLDYLSFFFLKLLLFILIFFIYYSGLYAKERQRNVR